MGNHHWRTEEVNIIARGFHHIPDKELIRKLPGRTILTISQKRRNMRLKYTQEWINEQVRKQIITFPEFC